MKTIHKNEKLLHFHAFSDTKIISRTNDLVTFDGPLNFSEKLPLRSAQSKKKVGTSIARVDCRHRLQLHYGWDPQTAIKKERNCRQRQLPTFTIVSSFFSPIQFVGVVRFGLVFLQHSTGARGKMRFFSRPFGMWFLPLCAIRLNCLLWLVTMLESFVSWSRRRAYLPFLCSRALGSCGTVPPINVFICGTSYTWYLRDRGCGAAFRYW